MILNGVSNNMKKMRTPKKNGWLDKKLHSMVVNDINAPIFQVKKFIISFTLFLFVVYGDVLPFILSFIGLVGCLLFLFYNLIKFFLNFIYFDYINSIYKANGSLFLID